MIEELVRKIGSQKMLRIEQWRGETPGAWRVGIEWYSPEKYEFICEKPELEDALKLALDYVEGRMKV